jgi:Concanavalin A-like lectin/glucanases superfamily
MERQELAELERPNITSGELKLLRLPSLLLLNALATFPLLLTGYCGDDILNSQIRGEMIQSHRSLWEVTSYYAGAWIRNEGRLFPLAFTNFWVFYTIRTVFIYKLFVLGIVLAGLAVFYVFLRNLTGTHAVPVACLLLMPLFAQFRTVWDPVLGFSGQYPLLTLLLFSSLALFLKFIDKHKAGAQAAGALIFLCCGLLFEISYPLCLLYWVVAYSRVRDLRKSFVQSLPYFGVTAGLALISLVLKHRALASNTAYTPNLNPLDVGSAFLVQSFGAVPFSYFLLDPAHVFSAQVKRWPIALSIGLPLLILVAALTLVLARRSWSLARVDRPRAGVTNILLFGFLLFALPQSLISLSPRYQAMLLGNAYLPVYLSRIGLALLLATVLVEVAGKVRLPRKRQVVLQAAVLAVWFALFGLNLRNNFVVAIAENQTFWHPRMLLESALRRGLLATVQAGSILLVNGTDLWDNANEYSGVTRKLFTVYSLNEAANLAPAFQKTGASCRSGITVHECDFSAASPVYTVQIRHAGNGAGAVFLAHVSRVTQIDDGIRGILSDAVSAYFQFPDATPPLTASLAGTRFPTANGEGISFNMGQSELQVVTGNERWQLVSFNPIGSVDALSIQGYFSPTRPLSFTAVEKDRSSLELRPAGPEAIHIGYTGGSIGSGVENPAVPKSADMSIEVLVTPGERQVPWADILSNHGPDFRGFAIEQRGVETNRYSVVVGDGEAWMEVGDLTLSPGRRHYISIQIDGRSSSIFLDGQLASHKILPSDPAPSDRKLFIGNWVGSGRQFNGLIEEVSVSFGVRSPEMILADAIRLHVANSGQSLSKSTPVRSGGVQ